MTLYSITEDQQILNSLLEENGGELTEEIEQALEINETNFLAKSENYIMAIKNYEALEDRISDAIKILQHKKKVASNSIDRMKESINKAMNVFGYEKKQIGLWNISFRKSESVLISDEGSIPNEYSTWEKKISKTDIKNAIKKGIDVPGATLVENKSLQIK